MKRLMYADHSWLVGDAAADSIIAYAVLLAQTTSADSVDLHVLDPDGNPAVTSFVIGPATMLTTETTRSELEEPDNSEAIARIAEAMARYS